MYISISNFRKEYILLSFSSSVAKIFFSGGGDEIQSFAFDSAFASHLQLPKNVLYIPVAMKNKNISYDDCLSWITKTLDAHGIKKITMCTDLSSMTITEIKKYAAIYIGGGNTFVLMKQIRESGFDKLLWQYAQDPDKVIYGGSAGAIILGSSIRLAKYLDEQEESVYLQGLGFYQRLIFPHYSQEHHRKKLIEESSDDAIVALSEESGIVVAENIVHPIGDGVYFFDADSSQ